MGVAKLLQGGRECVKFTLAKILFTLYYMKFTHFIKNFPPAACFSFSLIIYCCLVTLLSIFYKTFLDLKNIFRDKISELCRGRGESNLAFRVRKGQTFEEQWHTALNLKFILEMRRFSYKDLARIVSVNVNVLDEDFGIV